MYKVKGIMKRKTENDTRFGSGNLISGSFLFSLFFFCLSFGVNAQEVSASIDTASIKIGEQITYNISVETNADDLVVFPEGQTFSPLEMIESYAIDTTEIRDRFRLLKEYALTQFDSGSYTIPRQRILINDRSFFTDSMLVEVANVQVDTTKQKLYPIKPSVEVGPGFRIPAWVWWLLGILLLIAGLVYLYFRRKRKKEEAARKLPPYEQAIFELQQLDNSHLLENREIKEYYSQLSNAVRRYLDEEIYDHAMESTTGELILYLKAEKEKGNLNLEDSTIDRLRNTLERADLAKFANTKPDVITAKEDRSNVEFVINDTKAAIPQPTEEELQQDIEYRERQERKTKVRKIVIGLLAVIILLGGFSAYVISTSGFSYFKDTYIGHPTKELLEGDWIRSDYGTPAVVLNTPQVLKRIPAGVERQTVLQEGEIFAAGNTKDTYYVELSTRQVASGEFDPSGLIENVLDQLEEAGARNIITKEETFTTLSGAEGIRIFGTLQMKHPDKEEYLAKDYNFLSFAERAGIQQIVVIQSEADTYADEITERLLKSIEFNNAVN